MPLFYVDKSGNEVPENDPKVAFQVNPDDAGAAAFVNQLKAAAGIINAPPQPLSLGPLPGTKIFNLGTTAQRPRQDLSGVEAETPGAPPASNVITTGALNVPFQGDAAGPSAIPVENPASSGTANAEPAQSRGIRHPRGGQR